MPTSSRARMRKFFRARRMRSTEIGAEPGDAEQCLFVAFVDPDREKFRVGERPGFFGIAREIKISLVVINHFRGVELIGAHQEIHLVKTVFARQALSRGPA